MGADLSSLVNAYMGQFNHELAQHLDEYAAAFLKRTQLPPEQVKLQVMQNWDGTTVFEIVPSKRETDFMMENSMLRQALTFYLKEDIRLVQDGVLEDVRERPAYYALMECGRVEPVQKKT